MNKPINILDKDYLQWVSELCKRYRQSQVKAAVKVNTEMLKFYWSLGRDIVALKAEARWGSKFLANLSRDSKEQNPKSSCFSPTNLLYMKNFFRLYKGYDEITPQLREQLANSSTIPTKQLPNLGSKSRKIFSLRLGNITNC